MTDQPGAIPRTSGTRILRAIEDTSLARRERNEGVSPTARFWVGAIRNFLLGIPFTGLGFVWAYRAQQVLGDRLVKSEASMALGDLVAFIPAAAMLLVGVAFLAPGQTEAALRFLGLGNVLDRLPFLKAKATP